MDNKKSFNDSRYILKFDINQFFPAVSQEWLLQNFPVHPKFKFILQQWLKAPILFNNELEYSLSEFPQGSVIGPLLANFVLDGLETSIAPQYKGHQCEIRRAWFKKKGYVGKNLVSSARLHIVNRIIRYADDFIIVTNSKRQVSYI